MRSILTQQSIPRRVRVMPGVVIVASGILAAVFLVVLGRLVRDPEYVAHVELRNERDTLVDVWVRGAQGGPWLPLAPVEPGQRVVVSDVVDQGDQWVFAVREGDTTVARYPMSRADLERSRWRVTLGADVQQGPRTRAP